MPGEPMLSYERRAWVIPNGHGMLWTDRVFETEGAAVAHLKANWPGRDSPPEAVRPVLATVRVSATIVPVPELPHAAD